MIAPARDSDLSARQDIAERAFKYERHQESLIVPYCGDSIGHCQRLNLSDGSNFAP
jgi:hypothetical protein